MVIRLPAKKQLKAESMIEAFTIKRSASLLELQKITGYLNFVSTVVPLSQTFLLRLYNMQLYFPPGSRHCKRHISSEAQKDLVWWAKALASSPERSIAAQTREIVSTWSDAASTKGLGAIILVSRNPTLKQTQYYLSHYRRRPYT